MSPPAAAAAPAVRRAGTAAPTRPRAVPRPRRVSGPARRQRPVAPIEQERAERGVAVGLLAALDRLQRHRLLDRLIAGRTWIALVAFALIGIVTLQLLLLTLNGDIGRALEREAQLQRENAAISIEDSELAAGERVEAQAAHLGMQLVPEGALRFLSATPPGVIGRAAAALSAPLQSTTTSAEADASTQTTAAETSANGAEAPASGQAATSTEAASAGSAQAPAPSTSPLGGEASAAALAPATTPQPSATEAPPASSAGAATPAGGTQAGPAG
jgi:cell division protein FtsL